MVGAADFVYGSFALLAPARDPADDQKCKKCNVWPWFRMQLQMLKTGAVPEPDVWDIQVEK